MREEQRDDGHCHSPAGSPPSRCTPSRTARPGCPQLDWRPAAGNQLGAPPSPWQSLGHGTQPTTEPGGLRLLDTTRAALSVPPPQSELLLATGMMGRAQTNAAAAIAAAAWAHRLGASIGRIDWAHRLGASIGRIDSGAVGAPGFVTAVPGGYGLHTAQ